MAASEIRLGVDMGGTKLLLLVDDNYESKTHRVPTGPDFTPETLVSTLTQFLNSVYPHEWSVTSCGVAVCGLTDSEGVIKLCELPRMTNYNIKTGLQKVLSSNDVYIINDADAALKKVHNDYKKAGKPCDNIGVFVCGTGIGAAHYVNGMPLQGPFLLGIGSCPIMITDSDRTVSTQTADALGGGRHIIAELSPITPQEAIKLLKGLEDRNLLESKDNKGLSPDEVKCRDVIQKAGYALGVALAIILGMLNPTSMVLAGGVFNFPGIKDAVLKSAALQHKEMCPETFTNCEIVESLQRNELVAAGALLHGVSKRRKKLSDCLKLLAEIQNHKDAWPFNAPVDPIALLIPDYFAIIKNPMDLRTIKVGTISKLFFFLDAKEFHDHVMLVWENACTYNMPGSGIHNMATELRVFYIQKWDKLESDWA